MAAAYLLHNKHEITVFEKENYIGGHSRTIDVTVPEGSIAVDTGFIVFNYKNYPLLTGLFNHLDVPVVKSNMSFAASIDNGWLEYGTKSTAAMFAQKKNLVRPAFWQMIQDILHFNKHAKNYLDKDSEKTLGECMDELGMGEWFKHYFMLAIGGAIWSTGIKDMLNFPASSFIRFFDNHGLLSVNGQPQWHTVSGGSREYVNRLTAPFLDKIRLNSHVTSVRRGENGVEITANGQSETFDQVIFACHTDQAISILDTPNQSETDILRAIDYTKNTIIVHSDESFMPKRKSAWASWVYLCEGREDQKDNVSLSYWMNSLQPLATKTPILVTLNPSRRPKEELIHNEHMFEHPLFNEAAMRAQQKIETMQGIDNIWYVGAWQRYGFHEDGMMSAVNVAKKLGAELPW